MSSVGNYRMPWSETLQAYSSRESAPQPDGSSKLCLSCHDGTQAMDVVINGAGSGNYNPAGAEIDPGGIDFNMAISRWFALFARTFDAMRLELRDHHRNNRGVAHGGVITSLLDSALGGAVIASMPKATRANSMSTKHAGSSIGSSTPPAPRPRSR